VPTPLQPLNWRKQANALIEPSRWTNVFGKWKRYIGCKQRLKVAVNDRLGIEPG
jgi:hypothetical protein